MNNDFTFQVNISPGDVNYAAVTVRALANQHLGVENRLLIVDCCKPQASKLVNPLTRFPEPDFSGRVEKICALAAELKQEGLFTEVRCLMPGDEIFKQLSKKYLGGVVSSKYTHGAGATANMAYWAAMDLPATRYVIHYDGDIFLHQANGYEWWKDAAGLMADDSNIMFATPRHAAPTENTMPLPSFHEGTEIEFKGDHWVHNWFGTRVFLLDRKKLQAELPLVRGKLKLELMLRKLPLRAFPLDPEIILYKRLGITKSQRRLILHSTKAWTMHPVDKGDAFIQMLPSVINCIQKNEFPNEQAGYEDMKLSAWKTFLKHNFYKVVEHD